MRLLALIDNKIDKDETIKLLQEYADFYKKMFDIETTSWVERKDFTNVPTVPDKDGDLKPTEAYRKALETDVHKRYGDYGTDRIIMWVHEDNFLYKGIWGSAWSYAFYKYAFELCRWDKDNSTNTFNTLLHEGKHPVDRVILEELGININPIVLEWIKVNGTKADKAYVEANGFDWDRDFVHGALPSAPYIGERGYRRTAANLAIAKVAAPYLKAAYAKRKAKHDEYTKGLQNKAIALVKQLFAYWSKK